MKGILPSVARMAGKLILAVVMITCLSAGNAGTGEAMQENPVQKPFESMPAESWRRLAGKRIYFGHMSVGFNILEGLRDVLAEHPVEALNIVETRDPAQFGAPLFAHSRNGKNHYPLSKLDDFEQLLGSGVGKNVDIAFFKFCFVDVTEKSDVQQLFARYKDTLSSLQKKHPSITFIHVTVPLTTVQQGPKAFVKKLIGRLPDGYADNIRRNEFNERMRKEYPSDRIFDLAAIESTLPDGTQSAFSYKGQMHNCLAPEYTLDGGHLNTIGRKRAAMSLLAMLAGLAR